MSIRHFPALGSCPFSIFSEASLPLDKSLASLPAALKFSLGVPANYQLITHVFYLALEFRLDHSLKWMTADCYFLSDNLGSKHCIFRKCILSFLFIKSITHYCIIKCKTMLSLAVQGKDTNKVSVATCVHCGNSYWLSHIYSSLLILNMVWHDQNAPKAGFCQ